MKALIESKDLLAEKRVRIVAEAMGIDLTEVHGEARPCVCWRSIEAVAFQMRDACGSSLLWCKRLIDIETWVQMRGGIDGPANNAHVLRWSTPKHWVSQQSWHGKPHIIEWRHRTIWSVFRSALYAPYVPTNCVDVLSRKVEPHSGKEM